MAAPATLTSIDHAITAGWCCVYMLQCADGSLYCGWTNNLSRRLEQHQGGQAARYTRSRLPVTLVWAQSASDRSTAMREEARIKRLPRAAKLALMLGSQAARPVPPMMAGGDIGAAL